MKTALLILLLFAPPCRCQAVDAPPAAAAAGHSGVPEKRQGALVALSPDGKFFAATRAMPDAEVLWRSDADSARLVVFTCNEAGPQKLVASRDLPSRTIAKWQWSPDSQYLVITTKSSGGHQPYRFASFVYCVADQSLRRMEPFTGMVLDRDFKFAAPDIVTMIVRDGDREVLEPGDRKPLKVVLHEAVKKMEKVP